MRQASLAPTKRSNKRSASQPECTAALLHPVLNDSNPGSWHLRESAPDNFDGKARTDFVCPSKNLAK
ncbi:hypothetical protein PUN4_80019 [Paraburkholderia unamae]|nr:hypothetical protein PUN4_80019 [Paraburkholderia unamae]